MCALPIFVVVGSLGGRADLGVGPLGGRARQSGFVAKFAPDGAPLWSLDFGEQLYNAALDVAIDGSDDIYVTGDFVWNIRIGTGELATSGSTDVLVAKLDRDGNYVAARSYGGPSAVQAAGAIAVTYEGEVAVVSTLTGEVDLGGGTVSAGEDFAQGLVVGRFDRQLNHIWS